MAESGLTVLIGGVSQLYQGDFDLGRLAVERLLQRDLGRAVIVEDLHYGAVAVAQRLEELKPDALIIVGAAQRGRPPGTVERRLLAVPPLTPERVQPAVADAITGYVTIDLLIDVCGGLGVLPARVVSVEVEPAETEPSERLSEPGARGLDDAVGLVVAEVRRAPMLLLAQQIRESLDESHISHSQALDTMHMLLNELRMLDEAGEWGGAFAMRDRLRLKISEGQTGEGMSHLDWGLWWALIEELDRLQGIEGAAGFGAQR
jgi:Ni,Fe-hydrogenase maturation factor